MGDCIDCKLKERDLAEERRRFQEKEASYQATINQTSQQLSELASRLKELEAQPKGHTSVFDLLSCPNCGPSARQELEEKGAVLVSKDTPKEKVLELAKARFPWLGKSLEIPASFLRGA